MSIVSLPSEVRTTQPVAHARFKSMFVSAGGRIALDMSGMNVKVMLVANGTQVSFRPLGEGLPTIRVGLNTPVTVNGKVETAKGLYDRKQKRS